MPPIHFTGATEESGKMEKIYYEVCEKYSGMMKNAGIK
jgi:hypothetical protein